MIFRRILSPILNNVIWFTKLDITDSQKDYVENMRGFVVTNVPAYGLISVGASTTSASMAMTKFVSAYRWLSAKL